MGDQAWHKVRCAERAEQAKRDAKEEDERRAKEEQFQREEDEKEKDATLDPQDSAAPVLFLAAVSGKNQQETVALLQSGKCAVPTWLVEQVSLNSGTLEAPGQVQQEIGEATNIKDSPTNKSRWSDMVSDDEDEVANKGAGEFPAGMQPDKYKYKH